jgi:hypothetical protein
LEAVARLAARAITWWAARASTGHSTLSNPLRHGLAGSARDRSFGWTSFFARLSRECVSSEGVVSELAGGTELAQTNIAMITAPIASTPLNASFAPVATRSMTPLTSVSPALNDTDDDARASALRNRGLR